MTDLSALPLANIRVLDCSRVLAGPFAAMLLGDLGADVIKLEPPSGDETRGWGPPFWGPHSEGMSAYYAAINRNKRAVTIDLKVPLGQELLDALALRSDLLIHNSRPKTAERLGLAAKRLAAVNPDLVVAVVGGFPSAGPSRERPAYDLLAQAMSGLMAVTGDPDGNPSKAGVAVLDMLAGLEVAVGALALLLGRRYKSARLVEASLVEVGVTSMINVLSNFLATGEEPRRFGTGHPNIVPYQSFPTADGHVVVAVGNDDQFARLLATLSLVDSGGSYTTNLDRLGRRAEVTDWISGATVNWNRDELVAALAGRGVPAGPVLPVSGALRMIEHEYDGAWVDEIDGLRLAPSPLHLDGRRASLRSPPPRLGEHTDQILEEIGVDHDTIEDLRRQGVVR